MHTLKPARGAKYYPKRVGRGNASGKGTTAGRGGKGQTSRSGGSAGLKLLGMRHMVLQTPKLRGFKSIHPKMLTVSLGAIQKNFKAGERVDPKTLAKKGLIPKAGWVKVLADGALNTAVVVSDCEVSEAAKAKIVAAGGEVKAEVKK